MRITTNEQLMELLDSLYAGGADRTSRDAANFWDGLFQQPDHPLSSDLPDAGLVAWQAEGLLGDRPRRSALDVGCGLGRNSRWLAERGFTVTGIDIAPGAIEEAARRSAGQPATFLELDFIREKVPGEVFDLVYDSGCFHHLAPHRRISYMAALEATLAPGGLFGICTFAAGQMGASGGMPRSLLSPRAPKRSAREPACRVTHLKAVLSERLPLDLGRPFLVDGRGVSSWPWITPLLTSLGVA